MTNNIYTLFEKIEDKKAFYEAVSSKCGRTAQSIEKNWFSGLKKIPEEEQKNVVDILQNQLRNQIDVISELITGK